VLHLDLDRFVAAVEVLRRPDLAGRPPGQFASPTLRTRVFTVQDR
jgi:hypothetical protein